MLLAKMACTTCSEPKALRKSLILSLSAQINRTKHHRQRSTKRRQIYCFECYRLLKHVSCIKRLTHMFVLVE